MTLMRPIALRYGGGAPEARRAPYFFFLRVLFLFLTFFLTGFAGVATLGYGAGLAAPSMMGGVAEAFSLRAAFAVASLIALAIAAGAGLLAAGASSDAGLRAAAARAFRRRSA